jgi:hypothetical protein
LAKEGKPKRLSRRSFKRSRKPNFNLTQTPVTGKTRPK